MNREELIVEALASDVHEEDGWLSDAQTAHLEWDADNRAVRFQGEGRIDLAHLAEIVSSVFEQAHTMSDDEREALARDIHAAHARRWCIRDEGETCPEARQIADALLARRTVQGEPTTMRQEAEKWAAITPIGPESAPIQAFEAGWRSAMSRTMQGEPAERTIVMCARCGLFPVVAGDQINSDIVVCDRCAFAEGRESVQGKPSDAKLAEIEQRVYDKHRPHIAGMAKALIQAGWDAALRAAAATQPQPDRGEQAIGYIRATWLGNGEPTRNTPAGEIIAILRGERTFPATQEGENR